MPQQRTRNGANGQKQRPQDQLDLYQDVVDSTAIDPFLDDQNLGLGNYKEREMWQQVESFKNGLYAGAAFKRLIKERSIEETKFWLAHDGWSYQVPDTNTTKQIRGWKEMSPAERREKWEEDLADQEGEVFDRRRWLERRGEEVFEELQQAQLPEARRYPHLEAMSDLAGFESDWDPPHNRMTMARHETSRSRGARLIDNVFQRVKKTVNEGDSQRVRR